MMFFAFLLVTSAAAGLAGRLGVPGLAGRAACMRWGMAAALVFFGIDHLATPGRYLPMMPSMVPCPDLVVLLTGLCELAGAVGLLLPRTRRLAGIMLAVYFVCVFPANLKNALYGLSVDGLPSTAWYYWVRLAFQPLAIWWALRAVEVIGLRQPAVPSGAGHAGA
jgi:uncharacterized membrane protein